MLRARRMSFSRAALCCLLSVLSSLHILTTASPVALRRLSLLTDPITDGCNNASFAAAFLPIAVIPSTTAAFAAQVSTHQRDGTSIVIAANLSQGAEIQAVNCLHTANSFLLQCLTADPSAVFSVIVQANASQAPTVYNYDDRTGYLTPTGVSLAVGSLVPSTQAWAPTALFALSTSTLQWTNISFPPKISTLVTPAPPNQTALVRSMGPNAVVVGFKTANESCNASICSLSSTASNLVNAVLSDNATSFFTSLAYVVTPPQVSTVLGTLLQYWQRWANGATSKLSLGTLTGTGDIYSIRNCDAPANAADPGCMATSSLLIATVQCMSVFGDNTTHYLSIAPNSQQVIWPPFLTVPTPTNVSTTIPWLQSAATMGQGWISYVSSSGLLTRVFASPLHNLSGATVAVIAADYYPTEPCYDTCTRYASALTAVQSLASAIVSTSSPLSSSPLTPVDWNDPDSLASTAIAAYETAGIPWLKTLTAVHRGSGATVQVVDCNLQMNYVNISDCQLPGAARRYVVSISSTAIYGASNMRVYKLAAGSSISNTWVRTGNASFDGRALEEYQLGMQGRRWATLSNNLTQWYSMPVWNSSANNVTFIVAGERTILSSEGCDDKCLTNSWAGIAARTLHAALRQNTALITNAPSSPSGLFLSLVNTVLSTDTGYVGELAFVDAYSNAYYSIRDCFAASFYAQASTFCRKVAQGSRYFAVSGLSDANKTVFTLGNIPAATLASGPLASSGTLNATSPPAWLTWIRMTNGSGFAPGSVLQEGGAGMPLQYYVKTLFDATGMVLGYVAASRLPTEPCSSPLLASSYVIPATASLVDAITANTSITTTASSLTAVQTVVAAVLAAYTQADNGFSRMVSYADTAGNYYGVLNCAGAMNAANAACNKFGGTYPRLAYVANAAVFGSWQRRIFGLDALTGQMVMPALMSEVMPFNVNSLSWYAQAIITRAPGFSQYHASTEDNVTSVRTFFFPISVSGTIIGIAAADQTPTELPASSVTRSFASRALPNTLVPLSAAGNGAQAVVGALLNAMEKYSDAFQTSIMYLDAMGNSVVVTNCWAATSLHPECRLNRGNQYVVGINGVWEVQ
jgi:hypothetical protein